jgi:hypothetical protein
MKGTRLGVAEHAEAKQERQRRGVPELEQGPAHGHGRDDLSGVADRLATAYVGLRDQLVELFPGRARACGVVGHVAPRCAKRLGAPSSAAPRAKFGSGGCYFSQPFSL